MRLVKTSLVTIAIAFSLASIQPLFANQDQATNNDEGMELIKDSRVTTAYVDPNADLGRYNRILLQDASVAFKKNWKRNQNRSHPLKIRDSDMEKMEQDFATLFREVFTEELLDGGYELVDQAGDDVLNVVPAIVEIDVYAPDIQRTAGRNYSFSESAGEMTLNLELFDSLSGDKLAKSTDRKQDFQRGYYEYRTSVSNRADAKRFMTSWAKALVSTLDEAKASTGS